MTIESTMTTCSNAATSSESSFAGSIHSESHSGDENDDFVIFNHEYEQVNKGHVAGKFTINETNTIIHQIQEFMTTNNIQSFEFLISARETNHRLSTQLRAKVNDLWHRLATELPHRSLKSIHQHAVRKFIQSAQLPWTDDEKLQLHNLVTVHGNHWSHIGKIMGRLGDECKHVYGRSQTRKRHGKFSPDESFELVKAIQEEMRLAPTLPLVEYPTKGIRWVNIAKRLGDERHNLDYLRRWSTIRTTCHNNTVTSLNSLQYFQEITVPSHTTNETHKRSRVSIEENKQRINALIDYFLNKKLTCESQVKWSDVDKALHLPTGYSSHKWKHLLHDAPAHITDFHDLVVWLDANMRPMPALLPAVVKNDEIADVFDDPFPSSLSLQYIDDSPLLFGDIDCLEEGLTPNLKMDNSI